MAGLLFWYTEAAMKDEVAALILDEPITEKDTLDDREFIAIGMAEHGGDRHWILYLTGLRVDENHQYYIYDLNPPFFTLEELLKPDPAMPDQLH